MSKNNEVSSLKATPVEKHSANGEAVKAMDIANSLYESAYIAPLRAFEERNMATVQHSSVRRANGGSDVITSVYDSASPVNVDSTQSAGSLRFQESDVYNANGKLQSRDTFATTPTGQVFNTIEYAANGTAVSRIETERRGSTFEHDVSNFDPKTQLLSAYHSETSGMNGPVASRDVTFTAANSDSTSVDHLRDGGTHTVEHSVSSLGLRNTKTTDTSAAGASRSSTSTVLWNGYKIDWPW